MNSNKDDKQNRIREARKSLLELRFEQSIRSNAELRSRISTLSSVVLGLSLLTLQVQEAEAGVAILAAWIFLGGAVIGSVDSAFMSHRIDNAEMGDSIKYWVENTNPEKSPELLPFAEYVVMLLSGMFLIIGVVLLIVFAANNLG